MAKNIQHVEWLNENSTRAYPMDDNATALLKNGGRLPENLLVDCRIILPFDGTRRRGCLSSVTVTAKLVTLTFDSVLESVDGLNEPIAVLTLLRPIIPYKLYPITAVKEGVGGWIALGDGIENLGEFDYRLFNSSAGILVPEAVITYEDSGVSSVSLRNRSPKLTGVVQLSAGNDISITKARRNIDGVYRDAIVIAMSDDVDIDTMKQYIGECLGRPEGRSCFNTPIYEINSVKPDCYGNIELVIEDRPEAPITVIPLEVGGMVLEPEFGLDAACVDPIGSDRPPYDFDDPYSPPSPEPGLPPAEYLETFDDGATEHFLAKDSVHFETWAGLPFSAGILAVRSCQLVAVAETPVALSQTVGIAEVDFSALTNGPVNAAEFPTLNNGRGNTIAMDIQIPLIGDLISDLPAPPAGRDPIIQTIGFSMGYALMFVITRRMNSGFWLEILAIGADLEVKARQQLTNLESGGTVRMTLSMWMSNGKPTGNIAYSFSIAGASGSGDPLYGSLSGAFSRAYWQYRVAGMTPTQRYIGVLIQSAMSPAYPLELVTPRIDNFMLNWRDDVPIPMPCLTDGYGAVGYDAADCAYPFFESGFCDTGCGRYSVSFISNNSICGITLPTGFLTYLRRGNIVFGFASDGENYVNLTMELVPDTCQVRITLIAANELNEIYAYGMGQLPDVGCSRVLTMQVLVGCENELFGIQLACE